MSDRPAWTRPGRELMSIIRERKDNRFYPDRPPDEFRPAWSIPGVALMREVLSAKAEMQAALRGDRTGA